MPSFLIAFSLLLCHLALFAPFHRQTPAIGSSADRGTECLRWMDDHARAGAFAALDDCRQLFAIDFKWLVLVNARTGIEDESILALKQKLFLLT